MMNNCWFETAVAAGILLTACSGARPLRGAGEGEVATLSDRYFDEVFFKYSPTKATRAGLHEYDSRLEDYSRAAIEAQVAALKDFETRFEGLQMPGSPDAEADRELLLSDVRSNLLELTTIRGWEKDPDVYSGGITASAFAIMSRDFAPADERLRSLVAREKQMPAVLELARQNLKDPPRRYTEIALEQLPGILSFFEKDVPAAFKEAKDAATLREFAQSNAQVLSALRAYQQFLQTELLPRSGGDYRIGAETYRKKLLFEESVDLPLDRLLEIGMADLRRNQRGFIADRRIVTIPSPVPPLVEETPPFMRALTFASMDIPGPFEKRAKEAFFNVTLPERGWTPKEVEEHMAGFNRGTVISTAIHEAYPGHYVQFLWVQRAPNKVRQLLGCGTNAEGWAHYTEQMMLDEGYGRAPGVPEEKDAAFLKLRLGQLQDALLRNARYVVGIQMHAGEMTFERAVEFFEKEGYQSHANAVRETKRGTRDPTYLVYTLGKLQIS